MTNESVTFICNFLLKIKINNIVHVCKDAYISLIRLLCSGFHLMCKILKCVPDVELLGLANFTYFNVSTANT